MYILFRSIFRLADKCLRSVTTNAWRHARVRVYVLGFQIHEWIAEACAAVIVEAWFHQLVRANFHGSLRPPFNEAARAKAGFAKSWYEPLS